MAQGATVVQVRFLAQELPHAVGVVGVGGKGKKKKKTRIEYLFPRWVDSV